MAKNKCVASRRVGLCGWGLFAVPFMALVTVALGSPYASNSS